MDSTPPPNPSKWSEFKNRLTKKWQEFTSSVNQPIVTQNTDGVIDSSSYICPSCQAPLPPELYQLLLTQTTVVCESCGFEISFSSIPK